MDKPSDSTHGSTMVTVNNIIEAFEAAITVAVSCGEKKTATLDWYKSPLCKLRNMAGSRPAESLRAHHLAGIKFSTHFVRVLKALYQWASDPDQGFVAANPFRRLKTPKAGQRTRTLKRSEMVRLYRAASPCFRVLLFALAHTMARPGEMRELLWKEIRFEERVIVLTEFKCQSVRRDGVAVRLIPIDRVLSRMLMNIHRKRQPDPESHVFLGRGGKPMTANAVRCAMRVARRAAGLDQGGKDRVVCYTMRHTGATNATRKGVRDNVLARIMGHTTTRTTARYQHLDAADMIAAIDQLNAARVKVR
ncbi:MAG: tyrosine-type recombinase/integrase [Ardenticatenales bacterium]